MNNLEEKKHDLLFVVTALLFIIFTTGIGVPANVPAVPVILPSV